MWQNCPIRLKNQAQHIPRVEGKISSHMGIPLTPEKNAKYTRCDDLLQRFTDNVVAQIEELGLNLCKLTRHSDFIRDKSNTRNSGFLEIVETCRLDNGGILPFNEVCSIPSLAGDNEKKTYVAFIPAAGAASRYIQPFSSILRIVEDISRRDLVDEDIEKIQDCVIYLKSIGADHWPLPQSIKFLLEASSINNSTVSPNFWKKLLLDLNLPKALYPCVSDGYSFLELKDLEHRSIGKIYSQVFVTPPSMAQVFQMHLRYSQLNRTPDSNDRIIETLYIEQGPKLSTIRFWDNGTPFLDFNNRISVVPAGHGALTELFSEVQENFKFCHSLFIRNIDNITGTATKTIAQTNAFLEAHEKILHILKKIRHALLIGDMTGAAKVAEALDSLMCSQKPDFILNTLKSIPRELEPSEAYLWSVLVTLFHTQLPDELNKNSLVKLYSRPFNLMGQVPNTQNDVGGTPCFVIYQNKIEKICIEVPHVSSDDLERFLKDPKKATHFNPVFVAAEIPLEQGYYEKRNEELCLLSKKKFRGYDVNYIETVLYEQLGNSKLTNCIFVELPRDLFNPHKNPKDSVGRSIDSWKI